MLAVLFLVAIALRCLGSPAQSPPIGRTLHYRSYFYVGQEYNSTGPDVLAHGQIYVEHLSPAKITQPYPLLMIHGHGMTGSNFLATVDGQPGWADYFLSKGYELYLIDQPARGRSAWQAGIDGAQASFSVSTIESHFTATQLYDLWPASTLHTRWPGNGSAGDAIFDNFYAATVPSLISDEESSVKMRAAGSLLLDKIGPSIVVTHSQAGQYGWSLGDARPHLVKAIVALEPIGPPFINALFAPITPARPYGLTEIPVQYSPPLASADDLHTEVVSVNQEFNTTCIHQASPPRKLTNLLDIPVLLVTTESSYHTLYDNCTAGYLRQAGVSVDHVRLADVGIHGNGHMMFMETNRLEIADRVVQTWLAERV